MEGVKQLLITHKKCVVFKYMVYEEVLDIFSKTNFVLNKVEVRLCQTALQSKFFILSFYLFLQSHLLPVANNYLL